MKGKIKKKLKMLLVMAVFGMACAGIGHYVAQRADGLPEGKGTFGEAEAPTLPGAVLPEAGQGEFIKWVDFKVNYEALCDAYQYDVDSYGTERHIEWIPLLAYLGAKYGGDFRDYRKKDMEELAGKLAAGQAMEELVEGMKYYDYYLEAYTAVLGGLVGVYEIELAADGGDDGRTDGDIGGLSLQREEKRAKEAVRGLSCPE